MAWWSRREGAARWRVRPECVVLGSLAEYGAEANRTSVLVRWSGARRPQCLPVLDFTRELHRRRRRVESLRLAPILLRLYRPQLGELTDWQAVHRRTRASIPAARTAS